MASKKKTSGLREYLPSKVTKKWKLKPKTKKIFLGVHDSNLKIEKWRKENGLETIF